MAQPMPGTGSKKPSPAAWLERVSSRLGRRIESAFGVRCGYISRVNKLGPCPKALFHEYKLLGEGTFVGIETVDIGATWEIERIELHLMMSSGQRPGR